MRIRDRAIRVETGRLSPVASGVEHRAAGTELEILEHLGEFRHHAELRRCVAVPELDPGELHQRIKHVLIGPRPATPAHETTSEDLLDAYPGRHLPLDYRPPDQL